MMDLIKEQDEIEELTKMIQKLSPEARKRIKDGISIGGVIYKNESADIKLG